ncbi:hypothetical protein [Acaryochloris marina]|uniref:hypothetical protein n=1 Tax=Acaryochloris marina TaxID=155978 RepID=UPI0021C39CBE|nr:hypothetical protein [Acaryochloris marina]BDM83889.1 hypothetical protein AM10699_67500 [Acaryochloris marina MBIC10699]
MLSRTISFILPSIFFLTLPSVIFIEPSKAATLNFSQSGFSPGGGLLNGQFVGTDTGVNDGILSFEQGEISSFSITYSGNVQPGGVPDFSADLSNLSILSFDLSTNSFRGLRVAKPLTQFTTATIRYPRPLFFTPTSPTTEIRTGSLGSFPRATFSTDPIEVPEISEDKLGFLLALPVLAMLGIKKINRRIKG